MQVPNVTHHPRAEAVTLLQQAGFLITIVQQDVTDPSQDGLVLSQSPSAGQKAQKGASVTITVGHLVQQPATTETTPTTAPTTTTEPPPTTTTPTTTPTTTATPPPPVTTTPTQ
jgi:serine/threonine-protein kinase